MITLSKKENVFLVNLIANDIKQYLRVLKLCSQDPPYAIKLSKPNERGQMVEGFIVDLLNNLSMALGFNYTIYEQAERRYGSEDKTTGKWDGMIGDLIERDSKHVNNLCIYYNL